LDPKNRKSSKVTSPDTTSLVSPTPSETSVKRIKRHKLFPIFLSARSKAAKAYQNTDNLSLNNDKSLKSAKQKS